MGRDVLVRDIRPAVHPHRRDQRIARRRLEPLVGHEYGLDLQTLGRAEYQLLHVPGCGVGIDPDLQAGFTQGATCFAESHAAAVKHTVIAIEKARGKIKRYLQLTTVMATKQRANAHAMPRMCASVAAGSPANCQANTAAKR